MCISGSWSIRNEKQNTNELTIYSEDRCSIANYNIEIKKHKWIKKDQQLSYSYVNLTFRKVMLSIKYKEIYCKQPVYEQRMANC